METEDIFYEAAYGFTADLASKLVDGDVMEVAPHPRGWLLFNLSERAPFRSMYVTNPTP